MKNEDLAGMSVEQLVERYKTTRESTALGKLWTEIGARLLILRQHAEGHTAMTRALDGTPLSFTALLDRIMAEMDAAGVADAQHRSIEDAENEPHRTAAYDYRAMLEERFERLLQAQGGGRAAQILDGR